MTPDLRRLVRIAQECSAELRDDGLEPGALLLSARDWAWIMRDRHPGPGPARFAGLDVLVSFGGGMAGALVVDVLAREQMLAAGIARRP